MGLTQVALFILSTCLALASISQGLAPGKNEPSIAHVNPSMRIARGRFVKYNEVFRPALARLRNSRGQCSGILVANNWVLSAKHCNPRAGDKVRLGRGRKRNGTLYTVRRVVLNKDADIALLQLTKSAPWGHCIRINRSTNWPPASQTLYATGYGYVYTGQKRLTNEARIAPMFRASCIRGRPHFLCYKSRAQAELCSADSGGGVLAWDQSRRVFRVVAINKSIYGAGGASNCGKHPGGLAKGINVSLFTKWILGTMRQYGVSGCQ